MMGVYDCYGDAQLKIGPCILKQYNEGDKVPIYDGVYIAYEGAVVIKDGVFVGLFENIYNKWGGTIKTSQVLNPNNPVLRTIQSFYQKKEKE